MRDPNGSGGLSVELGVRCAWGVAHAVELSCKHRKVSAFMHVHTSAVVCGGERRGTKRSAKVEAEIYSVLKI